MTAFEIDALKNEAELVLDVPAMCSCKSRKLSGSELSCDAVSNSATVELTVARPASISVP